MGNLSLIPKAQSANSLVMSWGLGTTRYKTLQLVRFFCHVMLFSKKASHIDKCGEANTTIWLANIPVPAINNQTNNFIHQTDNPTNQPIPDEINDQPGIPIEPCWSTWMPQPSKASLCSNKYQRCEITQKDEGQDWATNGRHSKGSIAIAVDCQ